MESVYKNLQTTARLLPTAFWSPSQTCFKEGGIQQSRIPMDIIFLQKTWHLHYKAESAGRSTQLVQSHNDLFDLPTFGECLVNLFLAGEEREVANVDGCRRPQCMLKLFLSTLEPPVPIRR